MKFVALLRGINVGTTRRIEMKSLKELMESSGFQKVSTYINSGNIFLEADEDAGTVKRLIEEGIREKFRLEVPELVKSAEEMSSIAESIPPGWTNDEVQRSDVAYLFGDVDFEGILEKLPFKPGLVDSRYVKGAVLWNVKRENYNKSGLVKLVGHPLYQKMTVRNVNTARYLAGKR